MSLETAVYALLSSQAAITDLVSDRMYFMERPQESDLPALEFYHNGYQPEMTMSGACSLTTAQVELNIYAATPDEITTIREAVRLTLAGYRGTAGATSIQRITFQDAQEFVLDEPRIYVCSVDLEIVFQNLST